VPGRREEWEPMRGVGGGLQGAARCAQIGEKRMMDSQMPCVPFQRAKHSYVLPKMSRSSADPDCPGNGGGCGYCGELEFSICSAV